MNKILIIGVLYLFSQNISAQIGGISGSKLTSVNYDVVPHHIIEFEPSFSFSQTNKYWDNNGELKNLYNSTDSISNSSSVQLRFTYGLFNKLEIGVTVPTDISTSSWGFKYILYQETKVGISLIGGLNIPLGNSVQDNKIRTAENTIQAGIGTAFSFQQNENLSFDFNIQYNNYFEKLNSTQSSSIYISSDAGYYIFSKTLQLIASIGYQKHNFDIIDKYLVTLNSGVTIETGKNYIIVLNMPVDILGKNIEKSFGLGLALTLAIE